MYDIRLLCFLFQKRNSEIQSVIAVLRVNLENTMSFWYNKSQFKICSSVENRKIANCIVSVFLKQRQISKTNHLKTMKAHADLGENGCWGRVWSNRVAYWKIESFFVAQKVQYFNIYMYDKIFWGQDFKDSNFNLSYFVPSYSPVVGSRFLKSS